MKAVSHMISHNSLIKDKLGFHCFLRQQHDYLYLTHTLKPNHTFSDVYYVEHFPLQQNLYDEHFTVLQKEKIMILCKTLTSDEVIKDEHITKFPIDVQEMMLKLAIQQELSLLDEKSIKNCRYILDHFKNKQFRKDDTIIITVKKPYQCFSTTSRKWSKCNNEQEKVVTNLIDTQRFIPYDPVTHKGKGYVGQIVVKKGETLFKIIDLGMSATAKKKVQISTGKNCESYAGHEILAMIDKVKVEINDITGEQFKARVGLSFTESPHTLVDRVYHHTKKGEINATFKDIRALYTKEELLGKNKDDLIRTLYWGASTKAGMCTRLSEWFSENDLMYDADNQKINK
jgi:hypothetical protein